MLSESIDSEIIDCDMMFYTFDDFMRIKNKVKDKLETKNVKDILIYRLYVSSRPWIKNCYKYDIWDWLNDYLSDDELKEEYNKYLTENGDKGA